MDNLPIEAFFLSDLRHSSTFHRLWQIMVRWAWFRSVLLLVGHQLAIDGKQLGGTRLPGQRQAAVQLVSVWAAEQRLCLAQLPKKVKTAN